MPPTKTPPPKKRKLYSEEEMKNAILAVRSGEDTVSSAARKYGVPRVTLHDKISGRYDENCKMGRKPILSDEEEDILVTWALECKRKGFPVTKEQLIYSAGRILTSSGRPNPFVKEKPGRRWFELFMGRHKNLSVRECQTLTTSRAGITEAKIKEWCEEVKTYFEEKNLLDILKDPRRVFNCDETAFFLSPKTGKVIAGRGDKSIYNISGNTDKENVTVLMTVSADGVIAPPMILYAYERIPVHVGMAVPDEWALGKSESGWMTSETFFEYVANTLHPYLNRNNIPRPVLLYMDGHVSHMSLELSEFCASNGIELVALLPNATHILQPLDVAVFHPLKAAWKKAVHDWRYEHSCQKIKKEDFPPLLKSVISTAVKPDAIVNGFKTCGLLSLDSKDVDQTKLVGNLGKKPGNTQEKQTQKKQERLVTTLKCIEERMSRDTLKVFLKGGPIKRRDEALFEIWRSIKKDLKELMNKNQEELTPREENEDRALDEPPEELTPREENEDGALDEPPEEALEQNEELVDEPGLFCLDDEDVTTISNTENLVLDESLFRDLGLEPSMAIELELPVTVVSTQQELINLQDVARSNTPPPSTSTGANIPSPVAQTNEADKDAQQITQDVARGNTPPPSTSTGVNIPSPYKNCLFWPGPRKISEKKKKNPVKIPAVVTSKTWKEYHKKLAEEKAKKEKEIQERRERRLKKQKEKEDKSKEIPSTESESDESFDIPAAVVPAVNLDKLSQNKPDEVKIGHWVVVAYPTRKQSKKFVGQVLDICDDDGTVVVKFLAQRGDKFVWPDKDDEDNVSLEKITNILEEPIFDRRGHLTFKSLLSV